MEKLNQVFRGVAVVVSLTAVICVGGIQCAVILLVEPQIRLWWSVGLSALWVMLSWVTMCEVHSQQLNKVKCFMFARKLRSVVFHKQGGELSDCGLFIYAFLVGSIILTSIFI